MSTLCYTGTQKFVSKYLSMVQNGNGIYRSLRSAIDRARGAGRSAQARDARTARRRHALTAAILNHTSLQFHKRDHALSTSY